MGRCSRFGGELGSWGKGAEGVLVRRVRGGGEEYRAGEDEDCVFLRSEDCFCYCAA